MSRLVVTVSGLQAASRRVASASVDLRQEISDIDDLVDGLHASFDGQVADQYDASIDNWVLNANDLMNAIEGLGKFLDAAAAAVAKVDMQLAAALGGAGSSDQITADSGFLSGMSARVKNLAVELEQAERLFDGSGFSSSAISGALDSFRNDWSDARKRMIESLRAAGDMASAAADAFEQTDAELMKALQA